VALSPERIDGVVASSRLGACSMAALVVMLLGLAGTRRVSRTPPMRLLREG
jgi:putative ABC transport system permease protein